MEQQPTSAESTAFDQRIAAVLEADAEGRGLHRRDYLTVLGVCGLLPLVMMVARYLA